MVLEFKTDFTILRPQKITQKYNQNVYFWNFFRNDKKWYFESIYASKRILDSIEISF